MRPVSKTVRAFTLIEVLMVVVIIGLAAAIVVPQMLNPGTLSVQAAARIVIADLLYAQNDAIARQSQRRVVFDKDANRYWLTDAAGTMLSVSWKKDAGANNYIVDFSDDGRFAGVQIDNVDFGGSATIEFDLLGTPSTGGTIDLVAHKGTRAETRYRITVAALTGRVSVAPQ